MQVAGKDPIKKEMPKVGERGKLLFKISGERVEQGCKECVETDLSWEVSSSVEKGAYVWLCLW